MEIRISDQLNSIINYAREEAMRTGSYGIAPDHLLLAILRHRENSAADALLGVGTDLEVSKPFRSGTGGAAAHHIDQIFDLAVFDDPLPRQIVAAILDVKISPVVSGNTGKPKFSQKIIKTIFY